MKSAMNFIRSSNKNLDIDDATVDRDYVHVVCNKVDLVPIATQFGRAFPMFNMKSSDAAPRAFKLRFTSVDDNDACDKSALIPLIDNVRNAARIGDTPCNFMHCTQFLEEAKLVVKDLNNDKVSMKIIRGQELEAGGFGGIFSVGQAAVEPPALCIIS